MTAHVTVGSFDREPPARSHDADSADRVTNDVSIGPRRAHIVLRADSPRSAALDGAGTARAALQAPGGPEALARGCSCSALANAGYRSGAESNPLVDPECPTHRLRGPNRPPAPGVAGGNRV